MRTITGSHFPKFTLYFEAQNHNFPYVIYEAAIVINAEGDEQYAEKKYESFSNLDQALRKMGEISKYYKVPIVYAMEANDNYWDTRRNS